MQKFILCLCSLMFGLSIGFTAPRAHAGQPTPFRNLITFDEFRALDSKRQEIYIEGLQALFADWAKLQSEESFEYQNASRDLSPREIAYSIFFAPAVAAAAPQACVYAGYVSNVDESGKFCQSPSRCTERGKTSKWVTCNPLVYGGGCAPQGARASAYCRDHAKSTEEIKAYVLSHKEEYMKLRSDLAGACPTMKNVVTCEALAFRVEQMHALVVDQLPGASTRTAAERTTPSAGGARVEAERPQRPPPGRPRGDYTSGAADGVIAPSRVAAPPQPSAAQPSAAVTASQPAPARVEGPRAGESNSSCPRYNGQCDATAMMQPMAGPQDTSWAGKTLMTLEEAQALYCRTEPINPQFLADTRAFFRQQQARVRTTSVVYDNCTSKQNKQRCVASTNRYYQCYFKAMEDNFEGCVQKANANRAASRVPNDSAVGAIITERGNVIDFKTTGSSNNISTVTVESYLGLMFGLYKVDLCKVQKTGASAPGGATSAVGPSAAGAGNSSVSPTAR